MSRNRKSDGNETHLWAQTVGALRALPAAQDLTYPQRFHQSMNEGAVEDGLTKTTREDAYQKLARDEVATMTEIEALDKAYETLSALVTLQATAPAPPTPTSHHGTPSSSSHPSHHIRLPSPPQSFLPPSTPSSAVPPTIPGRLKVSLAAASSPAPVASGTPNSALASAGGGTSSRSHTPSRSSPAPATPGGTVKEKKGRTLTAKETKWAAQLPLQPGRRVAFFQQIAGQNSEWMHFKVVSAGDGKKDTPIYQVQDLDPDEQGKPHPPVPTTLRYLLPLPDPTAPPSHPSHPSHYLDYAPGSHVMGLFPETTTFYQAIVVGREKDNSFGGGRRAGGREGEGAGGKGNLASYRLKFEDDEGQVRVIGVGDVVEWPGGRI